MFLIILKAIGSVYLIGAFSALVIMLIQDFISMKNKQSTDMYTFREYVLGFFCSWATVAVIKGWYEEDPK